MRPATSDSCTESSTYSGRAGTDTATVHKLLLDSGIQCSNRKVARIVRNYNVACARGSRRSLYDHLVYTLCMDVEQRRRVREHPDYMVVIAYADPTGEAAVHNVLRQQRRR